MNLFIKKHSLVLLTAAIFCLPIGVKADGLDQNIQKIVTRFEQQIQSAAGSPYLLAVRSFFDEATQKPSPFSEEIRDQIFQIVRDRYRGNSKIVILNWLSEKSLEINAAAPADEIFYKQGVLTKQLLKDFGKGFLIAGTTATIGNSGVIKTELIDMQSGQVLVSLKASRALSAEEIMLTQKTASPKQLETQENGHAPQTMPSEQTGAEEVLPAQEPQISQEVTAVGDSAAIKSVPVATKPTPEAAQEDLEYKVIKGVNFKYEGYVKDNKKHGQGTLSFDSGGQYIGQWRNDKKHGQGTYIFADGEKYVGQWEDNMMHGQGTYFFKSGNKYVGQWRNDKKHGQGTYHFKNGDKWEGTYSNNKKHGYGVYTWASGKSTKEYWQDGKLAE